MGFPSFRGRVPGLGRLSLEGPAVHPRPRACSRADDLLDQLAEPVGLARVLVLLALSLAELVLESVDLLSKVFVDRLLDVEQRHVLPEFPAVGAGLGVSD